MEKIKKLLKIDNIMILFICMCPIFDISSFIFRNIYKTNYSITTFTRPIIPTLIFLYIFFKEKNNKKLKIIGASLIYLIYSAIHLLIYKNNIVVCSFGTIIHEAQYLVNYSFMIMNLYIFLKIFNGTNYKKLHIGVLISSIIYILSIYVAIITKTSSYTYIEKIGYKGWFESGNSLSAILLLSTFIILSFIMKIKNKKIKVISILTIGMIGFYLVSLIGTRVGLIGFILAILSVILSEIFTKAIKKVKINKKSFVALLSILIMLILVVGIAGSVTIKRRNHLKNMENTIIDSSTGEVSNLTGDLTVIRNKIVNNELEENFMSEAQKKSVLELYDIAKEIKLSNTNTRIQQLIYHVVLLKNQKNIIMILFGNGYLINTNELVWEMEFPAFLINFGIIGFILYMMPFICMLIVAIKKLLKNIKNVDTEFLMLLAGAVLSFVLSTLSGYTFFNASSMIIIIITNILLKIKCKEGE